MRRTNAKGETEGDESECLPQAVETERNQTYGTSAGGTYGGTVCGRWEDRIRVRGLNLFHEEIRGVIQQSGRDAGGGRLAGRGKAGRITWGTPRDGKERKGGGL